VYCDFESVLIGGIFDDPFAEGFLCLLWAEVESADEDVEDLLVGDGAFAVFDLGEVVGAGISHAFREFFEFHALREAVGFDFFADQWTCFVHL
jgi:hypothetical protein